MNDTVELPVVGSKKEGPLGLVCVCVCMGSLWVVVGKGALFVSLQRRGRKKSLLHIEEMYRRVRDLLAKRRGGSGGGVGELNLT